MSLEALYGYQESGTAGLATLLATLAIDPESSADEHDIQPGLQDLAVAVTKGFDDGNPELLTQLSTLADTSRDVLQARRAFGLLRKPTNEENDKQFQLKSPPDCILEAARRIICGQNADRRTEELKLALRLVANCCADNNINRALIVNRDTIRHMKRFLVGRVQLRYLIPTLYNVCVEFDEPPFNDGSIPTKPGMPATASDDCKDIDLKVTKAEYKLGEPVTHGNEPTPILLLLDIFKTCDEALWTSLADLLELASRPALLETKHVLADPSQFAKTTFLEKIADSLPWIAIQDEDVQISICQMVLNLISRPEMQEALAKSSKSLEALLELPYLNHDTSDCENQLQKYKAAFLKLFYAVSAIPAYAEFQPPDGPFIRHLMNKVSISDTKLRLSSSSDPPLDPQVLAPKLVLMSNSLTTTERTVVFLSTYNPARPLTTIISGTRDEQVLIPALNLVTRLALIPKGQILFYEHDIFKVLYTALGWISKNSDEARGLSNLGTSMHSKHVLELQREIIVLSRLLIKSQPTHAAALLTSAHLKLILVTSAEVADIAVKLETGRLMIETYRSIQYSSASETPPPPPSNILDRLCSKAAVSAVISIVTESPSLSARTEGVFGLGLILSYLSRQHEANDAASGTSTAADHITHLFQLLAEQREKLLPIFRDIIWTNKEEQTQNENGGIDTNNATADAKARQPAQENLKVVVVQLLRLKPVATADTVHDAEKTENLLSEISVLAREFGLQP